MPCDPLTEYLERLLFLLEGRGEDTAADSLEELLIQVSRASFLQVFYHALQII